MYDELIKDLECKSAKVADDIIVLKDIGYIVNTKKNTQLACGFFFKKIFENNIYFTDTQIRNIINIYNKIF